MVLGIRNGTRTMKNSGAQVLSTACLRHCVIDDESFFEPTTDLPSFRDVAASFIGNISTNGVAPTAYYITNCTKDLTTNPINCHCKTANPNPRGGALQHKKVRAHAHKHHHK